MDQGFAAALLKRLRGNTQPTPTDPSQMQTPPMDQGIPTSPQGQSPFMLNQNLENQALGQGANYPVHPIVAQIMQHLGLLNLLRNQSNQNVVDPMQGL